MTHSTGPWKHQPRPHDGDRVSVAPLFITAACALLIAWFIGATSTEAITAHAAEQINAQISEMANGR